MKMWGPSGFYPWSSFLVLCIYNINYIYNAPSLLNLILFTDNAKCIQFFTPYKDPDSLSDQLTSVMGKLSNELGLKQANFP